MSVTFTPKGGTSPYTISYSVNDGTPVSATSSFTLSLSDTSTINIKANDANGSVDLSYTYNIEPVDNTPHTFKLVTELAELSDNSQVFFAAQYNGNMYVMGAANDKNRQAVRVTLQEEDLPPKVMMSDTKYGIMKVRNNADGSFSFYDVELDVSTGAILQKQDNRWLDVQGRLLKGKPTTKGRYLHNGKMVIIK